MISKAIADKMMSRIKKYGRGRRVFCAKDFFDLGSRTAIDQAFSRLARAGQLRRVGRGLYDWPDTLVIKKPSGTIRKEIPPDHHAALDAISRKDGIKIYPSGLAAANSYGLTTAVPVQPIYTTDGSSRKVKIGDKTIMLRGASRKVLSWNNRPAFDVIQALFWLGRILVKNPEVVKELQKLPDKVKKDLSKGRNLLPSWTIPVVNDAILGN
jgi:predicted transcriptional regulator of viral defense system